MPKGDEEEIALGGRDFVRFVAPLATRALLERPTFYPLLIRQATASFAWSCVLTRICSQTHVFDPIVLRDVAWSRRR